MILSGLDAPHRRPARLAARPPRRRRRVLGPRVGRAALARGQRDGGDGDARDRGGVVDDRVRRRRCRARGGDTRRVGGLVLLDDAYMPPVRVIVDALRDMPGWEVAAAVSPRTVAVRKVAEGLPPFDWRGEPIRGRVSFRYLPPARRAAASLRHRAFSTNLGLRLVGLARRRSALKWQKRT